MRKIIHIDCDCFYASVEMRDNPSLLGKPVAIGGSSKKRGVLSTCNYEARAFGLHSAMPTKQALELCPEVILLPHRFEAYREASRQVREIFERYTPWVEPLSLDEAFLDVSDSELHGGIATDIAKEICACIKAEVGITVSAGIAPNKFLAKVASDWQKPSGQTVIKPSQVNAFITQLPVKRIPGVGKATMVKMHSLNVESCEDLQRFSVIELVQHFGSFGKRLYDLCRGIDERPVRVSRTRKSLSVEHTYSENIALLDDAMGRLPLLIEELNQRLKKVDDSYQIQKCFVKVKFKDFTATTKEVTEHQVDLATYQNLLKEAFLRKPLSVRLLGIGVGFKKPASKSQLALFEG